MFEIEFILVKRSLYYISVKLYEKLVGKRKNFDLLSYQKVPTIFFEIGINLRYPSFIKHLKTIWLHEFHSFYFS